MKLSQTLYALLLHLVPVRELHYINGADTLPAPLDPQQERQALEALSHGSTEARDLLITHNLRLVVYIAKKFETPSAGIEDMISIGTIGLIKAVNTFEPTKNIKLATYASRCIENEILMYLRKSSNRRQDASIDEPLNTERRQRTFADGCAYQRPAPSGRGTGAQRRACRPAPGGGPADTPGTAHYGAALWLEP